MAVETTPMITPAQTDEAPRRCTVCGSHRPLRLVRTERWGDFWKCWSCGFELKAVPRQEFEAARRPAPDSERIVDVPELPKRKPRQRPGPSGSRVPVEKVRSAAVEAQPEFRDAQRSPLGPSTPAGRPVEPIASTPRRLSGQDRCPCGCGRQLPEPVRAVDGGPDVYLEVALTTWLVEQGYAMSDLRWSRAPELIEARRRAARFLRDHHWSLADIGRFLCSSATTVSVLLRQEAGW